MRFGRVLLRCAAILATILCVVHSVEAGVARGRPLRTGQNGCWNSSGQSIACGGSGQDGELRRGLTHAFRDNLDGTITDLKTALVWEKQSDDGSIHDIDNFYDWAGAFGKIAALNTPPCFAGYCDWRLPNVTELFSLLHLGIRPESGTDGEPAMVYPAFRDGCVEGCPILTCSCVRASLYWTSTNYLFDPEGAWYVSFGNGEIRQAKKYVHLFVRAVRGGV